MGLQLHRAQTEKEIALLNFAYSAVAAVITGTGNFENKAFSERSDKLYKDYGKLFNAIAGVKHDEEASSEVTQLKQIYEYLFT